MLIDFARGFIEYYSAPRKRTSWGGPFNNQQVRQGIYTDLLEHFDFFAIVETGAYRGTTTDFMARTSKLPVYTVEHAPRFYGFSTARFLFDRQVKLALNDSRTFLKDLTRSDELKGKRLLFYLDAHWHNDLPLADEIDIIFGHWLDAVVLVDDFQVPFDIGYAYDDYGEGAALTVDYIRNKASIPVRMYFPSTPSAEETGARRGCVVLAHDDATIDELDRIASLLQA